MDTQLPNDFFWCRKGLYEVQVELGCYPITEENPLLEGFTEIEIDGVKYAVKSGKNILEQNEWTASPNKPYILTGTVGERWIVKPSNLGAYEVNPDTIGVTPKTVSTKDPSQQEFLVAYHVPVGIKAKVIPSWAFNDDGTVNEDQCMLANDEKSIVPHKSGDYIIAKHIPGRPEYWELPPEERDTKEMAELYDPRVINGSIMETTYDMALTQEEIKLKYSGLKKHK